LRGEGKKRSLESILKRAFICLMSSIYLNRFL